MPTIAKNALKNNEKPTSTSLRRCRSRDYSYFLLSSIRCQEAKDQLIQTSQPFFSLLGTKPKVKQCCKKAYDSKQHTHL